MSSTDRGRAARTASRIRTAAAFGGLVFALAARSGTGSLDRRAGGPAR